MSPGVHGNHVFINTQYFKLTETGGEIKGERRSTPFPLLGPLGTLYVVFRTSFFKYSENSLNIPFPPPDPFPSLSSLFLALTFSPPPSLPDSNLLLELNNILRYIFWPQPSLVMCYSLFIIILCNPFTLYHYVFSVLYTIFPYFFLCFK